MRKFVNEQPFANANLAAHKLFEIANGIETAQEGRIFIELINAQFLKAGGTPDQFRGAVDRAIANMERESVPIARDGER